MTLAEPGRAGGAVSTGISGISHQCELNGPPAAQTVPCDAARPCRSCIAAAMARDAAILTGKEAGKTVRQMAKETGTLR